jgi:pimeloyl-ACP methyl ester carboxylesterase
LLQIYQAYADKPYTIDYHFLTNGNVYLSLAQLTVAQRLLLHPITGPVLSSLISASRMANGLARKTCTPALGPEQVDALESVLGYQGGMNIQHKLIQYLNERKENEVSLLEALGSSDVPATLIWGELGQIAPVAVADYVWEQVLKDRAAPAGYWRVPCANHYLQIDQPELLADLVRSTVGGDPVSLAVAQDCQPIKIGSIGSTGTIWC